MCLSYSTQHLTCLLGTTFPTLNTPSTLTLLPSPPSFPSPPPLPPHSPLPGDQSPRSIEPRPGWVDAGNRGRKRDPSPLSPYCLQCLHGMVPCHVHAVSLKSKGNGEHTGHPHTLLNHHQTGPAAFFSGSGTAPGGRSKNYKSTSCYHIYLLKV